MEKICEDLQAEYQELDALVASLSENQWHISTPSHWTIKEQIAHLAYFEDRAYLAASNAKAFRQHLQAEIGPDLAGIENHMKKTVGDRSIRGLIEWWRSERNNMLVELAKHGPKDRLPWYGPPMSALSFATARLMETWAHGQDIFDALRRKRRFTDRLRHIAHLGVTTFGWSYINRGLDVPQNQVRVELTAPSGAVWTWGPEDSRERIKGQAEDFCLVVVRRRHVDDTELKIIGDTARDWMLKAQCFAGPPSDDPNPGERL